MRLRPRVPDPQNHRLAELQMWAISRLASTWLIDVEPYVSSRIVGIVQRLRIDPANGYIEATVLDGTGTLLARWHIDRPAPQLAAVPGRGLILEGVPLVGEGGRIIMLEPDFETVSFPEVT